MQETVGSFFHNKDAIYEGIGRVFLHNKDGIYEEVSRIFLLNKVLINAGVGRVILIKKSINVCRSRSGNSFKIKC